MAPLLNVAIDVDFRTDVGVIFYLDRAFCDSIVQYFDLKVNVTDNKDLKEKNSSGWKPTAMEEG